MITIQVIDTRTAQSLGALLQTTRRPEAMLGEVGRRGANELRSHFRRRNRSGNRMVGRRTGFWRQVADSVQSPRVTGNQAVISITHPAIAQKVFGGTIRAKAAKALTIPVDPAAYGRRASVFERETGIRLFKLRRKNGGLTGLLAGESAGGIKVYYVLRDSVTQAPDAEALPDQGRFQQALLEQAERHLRRQLEQK